MLQCTKIIPILQSETQSFQNHVGNTTIKPINAKAIRKDELDFASTMEIFKMQNFEIPFAMREVAEKSIEQAQATYDKVKSATEAATNTLEDSMESSRKHVVKINEKVLGRCKS